MTEQEEFDQATDAAMAVLLKYAKQDAARLASYDPRSPVAVRLLHALQRKQAAMRALSLVSYSNFA